MLQCEERAARLNSASYQGVPFEIGTALTENSSRRKLSVRVIKCDMRRRRNVQKDVERIVADSAQLHRPSHRRLNVAIFETHGNGVLIPFELGVGAKR